MKGPLPLLLLLMLCCFSSQAQTFKAQLLEPTEKAALDRQFTDYDVYRIDAPAIHEFAGRGGDSRLDLNLQLSKKHNWDLELYSGEGVGSPETISVATEKGIKFIPNSIRHYQGHLKDDLASQVTLTLADDFMLLYVQSEGSEIFVEQLKPLTGAGNIDDYIVYQASDVKPTKELSCAFNEVNEHAHDAFQEEGQSIEEAGRMGCLNVELAIACDFLMFAKYGSVSGAGARASGIMNLVQSNYDNEFVQTIFFEIVEIFVSDCLSCDPWTSSTNAGTLLGSFRSWGNSGGFPNVGGGFAIGQLWTDRNFNGSTIGIAYLNAVCGGSRYHVCQDFSGNFATMRVLTAHEIGHNFGAGHDASGAPFIMAPSVNNSNSWSNNSTNTINSRLPNYFCLDACGAPPVASFSSSASFGCSPLTVRFTDESANSPTTWIWSFPGGSPSSSSDRNPTVVYNTPGNFPVTLVAINDQGSSTFSLNDYVTIEGTPVPDINSTVNFNNVAFSNNTEDAFSYFWDFGDGRTSQEESPTHVYREDGIYFVSMEAQNDCGSSFGFLTVEVVTPVSPFFEASETTACGQLTVQFENLSSDNANEFEWSFPGGNPSSSTDRDPIVTYSQPGKFSVSLLARNAEGENVYELDDLIEIFDQPVADFTTSTNDLTVSFTNTSQYIGSVLWNFGDGTTSTELNPVHTYTGSTNFPVSLTVSNLCGDDTNTKTVSTSPSISFASSSVTTTEKSTSSAIDCRGYTDIEVELSVTREITGGDAIVNFSSSGDASENADFEFLNAPVVFPAGSQGSRQLLIRVFDDQAQEFSELAQIEMSVSGSSNAITGIQNKLDLIIEDNDQVINFFSDFESGALPDKWTISQGTGIGWQIGTADALSGNGINIPGAGSNYVAGVNDASCQCNSSDEILVTPLFSLVGMSHAEVVLDAFVAGNGSVASVKALTSNGRFFDLVDIDSDADWQSLTIDLDKFIGQNSMRVAFIFNDNGQSDGGFFIDNASVKGVPGSPAIANRAGAEQELYLGPFADVYFKDDQRGHIIARVENLSDWDYGCTTIEIDRYGTGAEAFTSLDPASFVTEKSILLNADNPNPQGHFRITLYLRNTVVRNWERTTGNSRDDLQLIGSAGAISNVSPSNPLANGNNYSPIESASLTFLGNSLKVVGEFINATLAGFTAGVQTGNVAAAGFDGAISIQLFPNPTSGAVQLAVEGFETEQVDMKIFDLAGRVIQSDRFYTFQNGGIHQLPTESLTAGVYLVEISSEDGKVVREKLVKQ